MASTRSAPTKRMAMSLRLQPPPLPDTCIEHRRPWGQTSLCILAHSRPSVAALPQEEAWPAQISSERGQASGRGHPTQLGMQRP